MANKVHVVLQGKGGCGKSFIAALLAQHYLEQPDTKVVCIDSDPANGTFSGYKAWPAKKVQLCDEHNNVDTRRFDGVVNDIAGNDADVIMDVGATSFLPLTAYLAENEVLPLLVSMGKEIYLHTVVTGGASLLDMIAGVDGLAKSAPPEVKMVVWLNEYFGPVEFNGKTFEQMKVYEKHKARIAALVRLPRLNPQTFQKDLELMNTRRLTFTEAIASPDFGLMERQRLKQMKKMFLEQVGLAAA